MRTLLLALVALTLASCNAPVTTDVPDRVALERRIAEAEGRPPFAFVSTVTWRRPNGRSGTNVSYHRGGDMHEVRREGPLTIEMGVYHGRHWHQNLNGLTMLDSPALSTTTTISRLTKPHPGYGIAELNMAGHGRLRYYDARTYREYRSIERTPNGDITTDYGSRNFPGTPFTWEWTVHNPMSHDTTFYRLSSVRKPLLSDRAFEIPPNRRQLVTFPHGDGRVPLPVTFLTNGRLIADVAIGTQHFNFFIDSSAIGIRVDPLVARAVGLRELAPGYRIGVGRVSYARVPAMRIGALSLRDVVVEVQQGLTQAGAIDVVGSLGYDFLASVGLTIDYPTRRVSAVPPRAYVAPDGVAAYHLSVRSGGGIPMTTATINGTRTERMAVNTMAFPLATVFDAFERQQPGAFGLQQLADIIGRRYSYRANGGEVVFTPYAIWALDLGPLQFGPFIAQHASTPIQSDTIDGTIGLGLLRRFTVGMDLAGGRIDLVTTAMPVAKP